MAEAPTYDYYEMSYGGRSVGEDDWQRLSQAAAGHLDRLRAVARLTPYGDADECGRMATCAMAEALQAWEDSTAPDAVASEHVGSVSVTYAGAAQTMPRGLRAALVDAVRPWLHVCLVAQ